MTLQELRRRVRNLIRNREDLVTDEHIDGAINTTYLQLVRGKFPLGRSMRSLHFQQLEKQDDFQFLEGVREYNYPSDAQAVTGLFYPVTDSILWPLESRDLRRFTKLDSRGTGTPYYYTRYARKIYITPIPTEAATGKITYYTLPSTLSADTDEPVIPEAYHPVIAFLAAHDIAAQYNDEHADNHYSRAIVLLQRLQDDDELEINIASNRPIPVGRI